MIEIASKYSPILRQNGFSSKQPRFAPQPNRFFNSLFRFYRSSIQDEPEYGTQERDQWLREVWPQEPYLAGVINSVTSIDKNRGWSITGGRNQVKRFVDILHNRFFFAPDLWGWRASFGGSALSYYTSDLGSVTEIGRQGSENGPLDSLYFVDPVQCQLTGNFETPLKYKPRGSNAQYWRRDDYFRVVSMPSTNEERYGLGLCALSRCIELAKIMIGIYQYDNEMLLNRAPRGLLLLKGITEQQWEDAMEGRTAKLEGDESKYYGAIHVLAALDPGVELEAQLVALSQLPSEFDQQTFTDLLMYGYALCFGYDPREFWPVSSGSLGTATETETQHRKAGGKGGLDFPLGFAERLIEELPDTILFEFEERDLDGEMANAAVEQAQADVIMTMFDKGTGYITMEEARILAAQKNLIDPEWTENQEETVATDTDDDIARQVERAIYKFPDEPIVRYTFDGKHHYRTIKTPVPKKSFVIDGQYRVKRQIDQELTDYQMQLDELSQQAVNGEITQDEYEQRLEALTLAILTLALLRGMDNQTESGQLLIDTAEMVLSDNSPLANNTGIDVLTDQQVLQDAFPADVLAELQEDIDFSLSSTLADDIYAGQYVDNPDGLASRLAMWSTTAVGLHTLGQLVANPTATFRWDLGATQNHCGDCGGFAGQVMSGDEWRATGLRPQSRLLACHGYHCDCSLNEV